MKILIVDDRIDCANTLADALRPMGHRIVISTEPYHALDVFRRDTFELVICDYLMRPINGLMLLERMNAMRSDAYLVLMSGSVELTHLLEDSVFQPHACFEKPVRFMELINLIESIDVKDEEHENIYIG